MVARIAKSLDQLRAQVNAAAPGRDKSSDGWIGDTAHSARKSDHNPNSHGVVQALDITNDPAHGVDSEKLANQIRLSGDGRVKYVISNKKIANVGAAWRPYNGSNPHNHHCHISVVDSPGFYDDPRPWDLGNVISNRVQDTVAPVEKITIVRPGDAESTTLNEVREILIELVGAEKGYGALTEGLVRAFQKQHGLGVDGIVGRYTLDQLRQEKRK